MLRTPTFRSGMLRHSFLAFFGFLFPFLAKADVDISIHTTQSGNEVTADVLVNGFTDILSIQYALSWDPSALQFQSVESFGLDTDPQYLYFGYSQTSIGNLFFAWSDPDLTGEDLADCSYIFRLRFNSINGQTSPISINQAVMLTEVIDINQQEIPLTQNGICTNLSRISGKVFRDDNANCIKDDGETTTEAWTLRLRRGDEFFQFKTSTAGDFDYICPAGSYELSVVLPTETPVQWTSCQPSINLELVDNQTIVTDFGVSQVQNPSGVTSAEASNFSAVIYPNPVALGQAIPVSIKSEKAQALMLELLDMSGKKLHTSKQEVPAGETKLNLDGQLNGGLYLLKITGENGGSITAKLTVI